MTDRAPKLLDIVSRPQLLILAYDFRIDTLYVSGKAEASSRWAEKMHEPKIVSLTFQLAQARLLELLQMMPLHIVPMCISALDLDRACQDSLCSILVITRVMTVHCTPCAHSDHG